MSSLYGIKYKGNNLALKSQKVAELKVKNYQLLIKSMNLIKKTAPYIATAALPIAALAQASDLTGVLSVFDNLLTTLIPILLLLATVVFIWGVIMYITAGADEEKRASARNLMIYGVIGLFVILAAWGLVRILTGTFIGTSGNQPIDVGDF